MNFTSGFHSMHCVLSSMVLMPGLGLVVNIGFPIAMINEALHVVSRTCMVCIIMDSRLHEKRRFGRTFRKEACSNLLAALL